MEASPCERVSIACQTDSRWEGSGRRADAALREESDEDSSHSDRFKSHRSHRTNRCVEWREHVWRNRKSLCRETVELIALTAALVVLLVLYAKEHHSILPRFAT